MLPRKLRFLQQCLTVLGIFRMEIGFWVPLLVDFLLCVLVHGSKNTLIQRAIIVIIWSKAISLTIICHHQVY